MTPSIPPWLDVDRDETGDVAGEVTKAPTTWQLLQMSSPLLSAPLRAVVVTAIVVAGLVGSAGCGPSRSVRRVNALAAAAARNPTGAVVTLAPGSTSPVVYVQGDRSGSPILDVIGDVARDGGARLLEKKLARIKVRDLNARYAKTATTGISSVFATTPKQNANVLFELVIESVAIVAPSFSGEATAEIVVSARAVSRSNRRVLWRTEEAVARKVSAFVPTPRGAGGLYNLAAVAALSDKELSQLFNGLAEEAGRVVGRRVVNDSAD